MNFSLGSLTLVVCLASPALLVACSPTRPDGHYAPAEPDAPFDPETIGFGKKPDAGEPVESEPDADAQEPEPDPIDPDPPVMTDPDNPLNDLSGKYLMRIDIYSKAKPEGGGVTLELDSRVSNLYYVALSPDGDGMKSHEQLCAQSYYNNCVSNCQNWRTELNPGLQKQWLTVDAVDRHIRIDASGKLQAEATTLALGFDDSDNQSVLPKDVSDARVWNLDTGARGVSTLLKADTLGPPLLGQSLSCAVSTVQRYTTSFAGQLDLSAGVMDALVQKPMLVDDSAITGATISANGQPAQYCTPSALADAGKTKPDSIAVVRFMHYKQGVGCPTALNTAPEAAFEKIFPGITTRPSASDAM